MPGAGARAASRLRPPLVALPAALVVVAVLLPLAYLFVRASESGAAWRVLGRRQTLEVVADTLALVAAVTACAVVVAVPLAWLVTRTDLPGRRAWAVLLALPLVIPSYVAALVLLGAFGPRGLLQQLLEPLGVDRIPDLYGFPGALLALTLSTYPYVFVLTVAALRELDPGLEEASRGLGRSRTETFLRVTLPGLRPSLGAGSLLVALYVLADFGAVSLMQYDALTRTIFLQYRALFDRRPAAVLALVLVAITAVLLALEARSRGRARHYRVAPGAARVAAAVPLGRWREPALALCGLVAALFLLVPLAVLGYWLGRGLSLGHELGFAWEATLNSLLASALAAAAAVVAALPVALLPRRRPGPFSTTLLAAGYVPSALPGIVVALSLVFFAARYGGPLYQTLALLVFAYVVRFFPQALAGTASALETVSPRLEEAARSLGSRPWAVLATVTAPLARGGLAAAAALVFLSAMKELPATLLLRPIGFDTLATEIWRFTSLGFYSRAALPALLLLVASVPFVYLLLGAGRSRLETHG